MKTFMIRMYVKEPNAFWNLCEALDLTDQFRNAHFEFMEYATLELEFDQNLQVVSGRIVPLKGK